MINRKLYPIIFSCNKCDKNDCPLYQLRYHDIKDRIKYITVINQNLVKWILGIHNR